MGYLESVYPDEASRLRDWTMINGWIYHSIRYRRRTARGVQTPLETLQLQSGSCRDMATLLLEIARILASRFVSGYLDTVASADPPRLKR